MRRRPRPAVTPQQAEAAVRWFFALPPKVRFALTAVAIVAACVFLLARNRDALKPDAPLPPAGELAGPLPDGSRPVFFAWWNVENLFDDRDDKRRPADEEYDNPFARDAHLRQLKLDRLTAELLRMNGGRGPDVLAACEVESVRAAELLREALNAKLADPALHYGPVAMRDLDAGRHIAPCVISRVPADPSRTRLLGRQLRILQTRLTLNGRDLTLFATHWTSQLTQRGDSYDESTGRGKYAAALREAYREEVARDPAADVLICGDFNDAPEAASVREVLGAGPSPGGATGLLNLMAGKPAAEWGTHYYRAPLVYDQICVSRGMLDAAGWRCRPETLRVETDGLIRAGSTRRQPWRFGNPEPPTPDAARGYSDHFPVTLGLCVQ